MGILHQMVKSLPYAPAGAVAVAIVGLFWNYLGKESFAHIGVVTMWVLPVIVGFIVGIYGILKMTESMSEYKSAATGAIAVVAGALVVLGYLLYAAGAETLRYADAIVTESPRPVLVETATYDHANAMLQTHAGERTVYNTEHLGENKWSALYSAGEGVGGVIEWDGQNYHECTFNTALETIQGTWGLKRTLRGTIPSGLYDTHMGDTYGYCDGDDPVVLVPWVMWKHVFPMTAAYGGLSEIRNDSITYHATVAAKQFPGPVYGRSLAAKVENVNAARTSNYFVVIADSESLTVDQSGTTRFGQHVLNDTEGRLWIVTTYLTDDTQKTASVSYTRADEGRGGHVNDMLFSETETRFPTQNYLRSELQALYGASEWDTKGVEVTSMTFNDGWVGTVGNGVVSYNWKAQQGGEVCIEMSTTRCTGQYLGQAGFDAMSTEELTELQNRIQKELDVRFSE